MSSTQTLSHVVHVDPATRFVRSLPGNYIMLREAAAACGVSQFVLRKFIQDDVRGCTPSNFAMFGKVKIYLYTEKDIKSIQNYLKNKQVVFEHDGPAKRVGRPPKYSEAERQWRDQQHSKKWYWKNRVRLLTDRGDLAGAAKAQKRVDSIDKELRKK